MQLRVFSLVVWMVSYCSYQSTIATATIKDEFNLFNDVIEKHSPFSKCDPQNGKIVHINFVFYPVFIIELQEREQVLSSSGWIDLWWTDTRLTWNASSYGGIEKIYVKQNLIWIPDIINENSVAGYHLLGSAMRSVSTYMDETENQEVMTFIFNLKRHSTFYVLKIIIPAVILSILNSFVFIVPPESGEKVSMSVTTMLSLTVFLSYIGDITPNNSESIPMIALFVVLHLALGAFSIICNIFILNIHYKAINETQHSRRNAIVKRSNTNAPAEATLQTIPKTVELPDGMKAQKAMTIMRNLDIFFFGFFMFLSVGVTLGCKKKKKKKKKKEKRFIQ
ncbi:neuronal acetylcholine receptor subunit alpha-7-like [Haliotis asinina]|uniref:neuronal acetylcholine receptor subunit alpha-7-like n=1 Tax=Haliotis asinina TaxID=109174 RepID=UPI003531F894